MFKLLWTQLKDPLVLPFFVYAFFLMLEGFHPMAVYVIYPLKTFAVGSVLLYHWPRLPSLQPKHLGWSILIGAVACFYWVQLDAVFVHRPGGLIVGFNPYVFGPGEIAWGLIFFRILGASLVVPIMEELFWRGFLMRYLIRDDYEKIPLGTYQHLSFWVTTACFAAVHGAQWPLAVVVGIIYGFWFIKTKSLGDVMVAHGVTNFLLALYILKTQLWYFW